MLSVLEQAALAKAAAPFMGLADTESKNQMLRAMAQALIDGQEQILQANREDLAHAKENGVKQVMMDRLALTPQRIADMAYGVEQVAQLPDPIGLVLDTFTRPNGLVIEKRSVPMGVAVSYTHLDVYKRQGFAGVLAGGVTATAGGIAAAVFFGYLNALIFNPKTKK